MTYEWPYGWPKESLDHALMVEEYRAKAAVLGIDFQTVYDRAMQAARETPYPFDFIWAEVWRREVEEATRG